MKAHLKTKAISAVLLILLYWALLENANAQGNSQTFMSVSYVKVKPGKTADYLDLIKNYSPKITKERIKQGTGVLGWFMYEVRMPSGSANEYDFVSITVTSDFNLLFDELAPAEGTMERILPGISSMTIDDLFSKYESSRTVVRKEVIVPMASLVADNVPAKVAWVDFVKVPEGKENEYLNLETVTMTPTYTKLQSLGLISNRRLYKKTLPIGTPSDFDFMTVYFADNIASLADGRLTKILKEAQTKGFSGKITRSEIWQLVEYMDEKKAKQD